MSGKGQEAEVIQAGAEDRRDVPDKPDFWRDMEIGQNTGITISDDLKSSIDKMARFSRNPEVEREVAEKMLQVWDDTHDTKKAAATHTEASAYARGDSVWKSKQVSFGEATMTYYDILKLSGPDAKDTQAGRQKYDQIQAEAKAGLNEKLDTPESRKKATEHLVNALTIDESATGSQHIADRLIKKESYQGAEMLGELGLSTYGKAAPEVRKNALATREIQKESNLSFEDAYKRNTEVNNLTAEARKLADSGKVDEAAALLKQSMELSPKATGMKLGAGDIPLTETETGSPFYKAFQKAQEQVKSEIKMPPLDLNKILEHEHMMSKVPDYSYLKNMKTFEHIDDLKDLGKK